MKGLALHQVKLLDGSSPNLEHMRLERSNFVLSNMVATNHMWLFRFTLIKIKQKFSSLATPAIFHVLMPPYGAACSIERFHLHRKFCRTTLIN